MIKSPSKSKIQVAKLEQAVLLQIRKAKPISGQVSKNSTFPGNALHSARAVTAPSSHSYSHMQAAVSVRDLTFIALHTALIATAPLDFNFWTCPIIESQTYIVPRAQLSRRSCRDLFI